MSAARRVRSFVALLCFNLIYFLSYWGQNSYGATHTTDTANWQQKLSHYCQDDTIDAIPMAFVNVFFDDDNLPSLDLSNVSTHSSLRGYRFLTWPISDLRRHQ